MKLSDLSTPEFFENPYPLYAQLHNGDALHYLAPNLAMTANFSLIEAMFADRRLGKALLAGVRARYGETGPEQPVFQALSRMFLFMNPPVHTRLRALATKAFSGRNIDSLRNVSQAASDQLIDALPAEGEFDLMRDLATPLPVAIICRLLDLPVEDGLRLGAATAAVSMALDVAPLGPDTLARANAAAEELEAYFRTVVEARRKAPGTDLVSAFVTAEVDGDRLSDDEVISQILLLFAAGHETTSNMIGNALLALFRHPDQLAKLKADLSLMPQAIAECLRYDASVQAMTRAALEDATIEGVTIPRGTVVFMMIGAANRDPARFAHPDRLDITRTDAGKQIAFGGGIHYCLGARLAQLEMEVALTTLLRRVPHLTLTDTVHPQWRRQGNIRGLQVLPATREPVVQLGA
ncbi:MULTISPECIES: cytochrome P450 [unclassified Cupriavidus]|uniref:cytochrome P450 n=1 Tax=unclassified Cupriavidus TaxID=2640874 RepID=UPI00313AEDCC